MTPSDSPGPKIGGRCKQRAISFYGGRVIANFVPKFIAMATGFGRGKILMIPSDSPGPKIGGRCKQRAIIFHGDRVISHFVPNFVAMATAVDQG